MAFSLQMSLLCICVRVCVFNGDDVNNAYDWLIAVDYEIHDYETTSTFDTSRKRPGTLFPLYRAADYNSLTYHHLHHYNPSNFTCGKATSPLCQLYREF